MKKKIFSFLFIIALVLLFNINVKAFDRDYNVKDYSNTLSYSQLESLKDSAEKFYKENNLELVIVIYDSGYNEYSLERAGDSYFDNKYYNDYGVYLALDVSNAANNDYIAVIKGSDKYYSDSEIERMYTALSGVKYSGTYAICNKFVDVSNKYKDEEKSYGGIFMLIILPFIIAIITISVLIKKNKLVQKATQASAYLDKSNVNITNRQDRYITTTTSRVRINTSSSSGGHHSGGSRGMSRGGGGRHL